MIVIFIYSNRYDAVMLYCFPRRESVDFIVFFSLNIFHLRFKTFMALECYKIL